MYVYYLRMFYFIIFMYDQSKTDGYTESKFLYYSAICSYVTLWVGGSKGIAR